MKKHNNTQIKQKPEGSLAERSTFLAERSTFHYTTEQPTLR